MQLHVTAQGINEFDTEFSEGILSKVYIQENNTFAVLGKCFRFRIYLGSLR